MSRRCALLSPQKIISEIFHPFFCHSLSSFKVQYPQGPFATTHAAEDEAARINEIPKHAQQRWSFMRNLRILAMLSLVTFSVLVAITNGIAARERWKQSVKADDSVTKWEKRILPVLDQVPGDVSVFGYVADWDIPEAGYNLVDQDQEFVLTQYVLAPRILQRGLDHEWIIGNFISADFSEWLDQNLSSYELTKFGFGIYLIHRTLL